MCKPLDRRLSGIAAGLHARSSSHLHAPPACFAYLAPDLISSPANAAAAGALSGLWVGLLIGILFGLFTTGHAWLAMMAVGIGLGLLWGAIFGFVAHLAARGERDFSSLRGCQRPIMTWSHARGVPSGPEPCSSGPACCRPISAETGREADPAAPQVIRRASG